MRDEGTGPSGPVCSKQAPNHLKLRWLRARVVLRYEATNGDGGRSYEIGIQVQISKHNYVLSG
jgi:hypothetical protein